MPTKDSDPSDSEIAASGPSVHYGSTNEAICKDEDSRTKWRDASKPWQGVNNTKDAGRLNCLEDAGGVDK